MNGLLHDALALAAVLPALGMLALIWRTRDGSRAQRDFDEYIATRPIREFDPRIQAAIAADRGLPATVGAHIDSNWTAHPSGSRSRAPANS
jgi:hypothetical protein